MLCFYGVLRSLRWIVTLTTARDQTHATYAISKTHPIQRFLPHYIADNQPLITQPLAEFLTHHLSHTERMHYVLCHKRAFKFM